MKRAFLIIILFSTIFVSFSLYGDIEEGHEVLVVNPKYGFFVIAGGADKGMEIGGNLIVQRGSEKIAEASIIEVRPHASAAEILYMRKGETVQEGDNALVVSEAGPERVRAGEKTKPESKWTRSTGSGSPASPQGDVISMSIDKDYDSVFYYCGIVLRENGFSVISSNRAIGSIMATKPIELSLFKELWADATAAIDHSLIASFEIRRKGDSSNIEVSSHKTHSQKDKFIKLAVTRNSEYYNELIDIVSEIKKRSEY